jgi:hypothetical protein
MKTILILESNPRRDLSLNDEMRELEAVIERSRDREQFQVKLGTAVRVGDLQELLLRHEPQIVHFCGHGMGEEGLVFQDEAGREKPVDTDALATLFGLAESVECVVLNACYSAVQADEIVNHIDYVIGMKQAIRDDAARQFTQGFYRALGYGKTIAVAYEWGCNAIQLMLSGGATTRSGNGVEGAERQLSVVGAETDGQPVALPEHLKPVLRRRHQGAESRLQSPVSAPLALESPEGQVRMESRFYLHSPYEERCHEELQKPGSLVRIKSPRNMGKSSLMVRVLAHAAQLGYRTVTIDLEQTNQKFFHDLDKFMQWFCASVGKPLGVRVKIEDYWDDIFGANDNATEYFEQYLLNGSQPPLVLAIDNFDRIFAYPEIETDFCGLLRGWYERSRSDARWGNLRLLIRPLQK